jgi:hypothetical protein
MDTLPVKSQSAPHPPWSMRQLDYSPKWNQPRRFRPSRCVFSPVASEQGDIYALSDLVKEPGVWCLTISGEKISCSFVPTDFQAGTSRFGQPCLLVENLFIAFGGLGSDGLDDTLYMLNICKDLSSLYGTRLLMTLSLPKMVSSETFETARRSLWSHLDLARFQTLCFWGSCEKPFPH